MTKLLAKALEQVMDLPAGQQDEVAVIMIEMAENSRMIEEWGLTAAQVEEVRAAIAEDKFLTDEETDALWERLTA